MAASGAVVLAIPLSISRGLFFTIGVVALFAVLAVGRKPQYLGKLLVSGLAIVVLLLTISQLSYFQTATEAFLIPV